jgi:hypothetical protein
MAGVAIAALLVTFVARKNPLMGWLAASRTINICVYLRGLRFLRGWAVIPNSEFAPRFSPRCGFLPRWDYHSVARMR